MAGSKRAASNLCENLQGVISMGFGFQTSDFFRDWVFRHSCFFRASVYALRATPRHVGISSFVLPSSFRLRASRYAATRGYFVIRISGRIPPTEHTLLIHRGNDRRK